MLDELKDSLDKENERLGLLLDQKDELYNDLNVKKKKYQSIFNNVLNEELKNEILITYNDADSMHEEICQMIKDTEQKIKYYQQFIFDMSEFKLVREDGFVICEPVFGSEIYDKCKPYCNMKSIIKNPNDQIVGLQMFNSTSFHPYIHIYDHGTFTLIIN